jgi:hypothetical protein
MRFLCQQERMEPINEKFYLLDKLAPQVGLEPTTKRLTAARSTAELLRSVTVVLSIAFKGVSINITMENKNKWVQRWLPSRDSNPGQRIQSPVCYHYTTRHWCRRPGSNRHGGCPPTVFETAASAYSATSAVVPRSRIELLTPRFSVACSTN